MKKSIMTVCAHADDVELQAGGTLAKYIADGYKGYYVQTTKCNSGYNCLTSTGDYKYSEMISDMRQEEILQAAKVFGAEPVLMGFKEHLYTMKDGRRLYADIKPFPEIEEGDVTGREPIVVACTVPEHVAELAEKMRQAEPELVLTHMPDYNPDHYCTMLLALKAFTEAGKDVELGGLYIRVKRLDHMAMTIPVEPDFFVDVSAHIDVVDRAIVKHVSQCRCNDRRRGLRRDWRLYADRVAGAEHVEAFRRIA